MDGTLETDRRRPRNWPHQTERFGRYPVNFIPVVGESEKVLKSSTARPIFACRVAIHYATRRFGNEWGLNGVRHFYWQNACR